MKNKVKKETVIDMLMIMILATAVALLVIII